MNAKRLGEARYQPRIVQPRGRFLVRVADAKPSAKIEVFERDSRSPQFAHIAGDPLECHSKRPKRGNLRADVRADPVPANPFRLTAVDIEFPCSRPIQSEFV